MQLNSNPLFSIIVQTYNRAELINATLKSLLSQMFTNYKILFIDDGGTDRTKEVVERLGDSRIHYYLTHLNLFLKSILSLISPFSNVKGNILGPNNMLFAVCKK